MTQHVKFNHNHNEKHTGVEKPRSRW